MHVVPVRTLMPALLPAGYAACFHGNGFGVLNAGVLRVFCSWRSNVFPFRSASALLDTHESLLPPSKAQKLAGRQRIAEIRLKTVK